MSTVHGSCACGQCTYTLTKAPTVRLICHCTICQAFTGNAYADMLIEFGHHAQLRGMSQVRFKHFKRWRFPPPNLARGRCTICLQPFIEMDSIWPVKLLLIPAASVHQPASLPAPAGHLFYEHRRADADDNVPKHTGYLASQLAIARMIWRAM